MAEKKLNVGDEVLLISGGHAMTVIKTEGLDEKHAECQWFEGNGKSYKEVFVKAALDLAEEIDKNNVGF
ncbi:MAG: DUF2158 domain-containing protein [bacterium]|jgi:uncharacterized protein YodC (DUF2158 family)